jgi:ATP-dependent Clp protease protease subunit
MKYLLMLLLLFGCANSNVRSSSVETLLLTEANTINFREPVTSGSVRKIINEITAMRQKDPNNTIYLVMNSPGGSITDGLDFIRFLDTQENIKTITIFAASMASAIVEANKGERLIVEDGIMMFHRAKGSFSGQFNEGEVEAQLKAFTELVLFMENKNADRVGISLKEYKQKVVNEWWIIGKNNVSENVVDRIVKMKCDAGLTKARTEVDIETFFGSVTVLYSKCPLLTNLLEVKKPEAKK